MADAPLRVGLLGAAKIAPQALIAPARARDDVVVTHVAARDPHRAAAFAAEHELQAVHGYQALIERDDIELVYIALPPAAHCEWAIRALRAGKAVLCEKPFACSADEARRMVEAARASGRPLIEAFHYRFHGAMTRAIDVIRSGALGRIRAARAGFGTTIPRAPDELRWSATLGGGAVMDLGCYPVHALRSLLNEEPQLLFARAVFESGVESQACMSFTFPGGARADAWCSMTSPTIVWDLEIIGERGRLSLSNFIAPQYGCVLRTDIDGVTSQERLAGPSSYDAQLAHVIDVLNGRTNPVTGGEDAIANMTVIETIRAHARSA